MFWWIVLFLLGPASVPRAQELKFTKTPESTNCDIMANNMQTTARPGPGKPSGPWRKVNARKPWPGCRPLYYLGGCTGCSYGLEFF